MEGNIGTPSSVLKKKTWYSTFTYKRRECLESNAGGVQDREIFPNCVRDFPLL